MLVLFINHTLTSVVEDCFNIDHLDDICRYTRLIELGSMRALTTVR